jgi:hypothetical protein
VRARDILTWLIKFYSHLWQSSKIGKGSSDNEVDIIFIQIKTSFVDDLQ